MVLGLCLGAIVPTIAADAASTIRPGDTIRAEMPFGDPFETSARFELVAEEAGPLTIEARSNEFDIDMKVLRVGSGGESETIAEDGDAGAGPNSLLVIEAETGARYVIEVQPAEFSYCGGKYDLSVSRGKTEPVDAQALRRKIGEFVGLTFFAPMLKQASESKLKGKYGHGGRGEEIPRRGDELPGKTPIRPHPDGQRAG